MLFSRDDSPLLQNFRVISAEAVNALDDKHIVGLEFAQKFFVLRTLEILAASTVDENFFDAEIFQRDKLSLFVLVFGRDASITVTLNHDFSSNPLQCECADCKEMIRVDGDFFHGDKVSSVMIQVGGDFFTATKSQAVR